MDAKIFSDRLKNLGWTNYRLAQELDKIRQTNKGAGNYTSTVDKFVQSPDSSRTKTFLDLVKAMGGEVAIKWKITEEVLVEHQEVKL